MANANGKWSDTVLFYLLHSTWQLLWKFFRSLYWILTCLCVTPSTHSLNYSFNTKPNTVTSIYHLSVTQEMTASQTQMSFILNQCLSLGSSATVNHFIHTASILCQIWGILSKHELLLRILWIPDSKWSRNCGRCSSTLTWHHHHYFCCPLNVINW